MSKIESRCGLLCDTCTFKESNGCMGCVETNGHPFYGECHIAKCCQDKGLAHCGECSKIPEYCGIENCGKADEKGFFPCDSCNQTTCGKLHAYSFKDPNHGDNPPGLRIDQCKKWKTENA